MKERGWDRRQSLLKGAPRRRSLPSAFPPFRACLLVSFRALDGRGRWYRQSESRPRSYQVSLRHAAKIKRETRAPFVSASALLFIEEPVETRVRVFCGLITASYTVNGRWTTRWIRIASHNAPGK